jgi:hypothetical protein
MIPASIDIGASWNVLPPGVHDATLDEVEQRFATNKKRKVLYDGLVRGCKLLKSAGCSVVFLDGSYVTEKPVPGDFDACWDPCGVDPAKLDPVLLDFTDKRKSQKLKYGGEFFPSSATADGSRTFVEYFRTDKETGMEKGLIRIRLQ